MAKLDSDILQFTAATTAAAITTGRKLARNFAYYRSKRLPQTKVTRQELLQLCRRIELEAFGLHNLMENSEKKYSPILVAIAGHINDALEELHRKLLFFDASDIEPAIPHIDRLRSYWKNYAEASFYSDELNQYLEQEMPAGLLQLRAVLSGLPGFVTI